MDLQLRKKSDWVIVDLNGRVDSFNYEIIREKVNTLLKMGKKHVAFNLEGVQFIALPNLRYLIQVAHQLKTKGGETAVVGCSPEILKHFEEVHGLDDMKALGKEEEL